MTGKLSLNEMVMLCFWLCKLFFAKGPKTVYTELARVKGTGKGAKGNQPPTVLQKGDGQSNGKGQDVSASHFSGKGKSKASAAPSAVASSKGKGKAAPGDSGGASEADSSACTAVVWSAQGQSCWNPSSAFYYCQNCFSGSASQSPPRCQEERRIEPSRLGFALVFALQTFVTLGDGNNLVISHSDIQGLVRVNQNKAAQLLMTHGGSWWFLEPLQWAAPLSQTVPPAVEWIDSEDIGAAAKAACEAARRDGIGVVLGQRQVGDRKPRSTAGASATSQPGAVYGNFWGYTHDMFEEDVDGQCELLVQTSRHTLNYKLETPQSWLRLILAVRIAEFTMHCLLSGALHLPRVPSCSRPEDLRQNFLMEPRLVSVWQPDPMEVDGTKREGSGGDTAQSGSEKPPAKKIKHAEVPAGLAVVTNDGQGTCLFQAISDAFKLIGQSLRAMAVLLIHANTRKPMSRLGACARLTRRKHQWMLRTSKNIRTYWLLKVHGAAVWSSLLLPTRSMFACVYTLVMEPMFSVYTGSKTLVLRFHKKHFEALKGQIHSPEDWGVLKEGPSSSSCVGDPADSSHLATEVVVVADKGYRRNVSDLQSRRNRGIAIGNGKAWRVPLSTSTTEQLDEFWDDVACATRRDGQFRPAGRIVTAGDFNAQLYEPEDAELSSNIVGRFRPPFRHMLNEYAYDRVASLDDWVLADSLRAAPYGNRHRCTWYSSIHRQHYELDWMLIARRHLSRVVSMTVRHSLDPLRTQHSAKEYVFRLEQTQRQGFRHHVPKPDLRVLRGNSHASREARTTLTTQVLEAVGAQHEPVTYPRLCAIAAQKAVAVCVETNNQCQELRRRKHDLQAHLTTDPANAQLLDELDSVRTQHRDTKNQQRQLQRQLEKDYWDGMCGEHQQANRRLKDWMGAGFKFLYSFGWTGDDFEADLMDFKNAYRTANKAPFWKILQIMVSTRAVAGPFLLKHMSNVEQQRQRRAAAKGQPKPKAAPRPAEPAVDPALPRQVRRHVETGHTLFFENFEEAAKQSQYGHDVVSMPNFRSVGGCGIIGFACRTCAAMWCSPTALFQRLNKSLNVQCGGVSGRAQLLHSKKRQQSWHAWNKEQRLLLAKAQKLKPSERHAPDKPPPRAKVWQRRLVEDGDIEESPAPSSCILGVSMFEVGKVLAKFCTYWQMKRKTHVVALQEINMAEREALQFSSFALKRGYRCWYVAPPARVGSLGTEIQRRGVCILANRDTCHAPSPVLH
eukprot:s2439_g6.t1